ncbi:EXS family-domain-containing protein [Multifurca ochricompacta]|uniref:EXS family-domain-containing protein n=1 Tax=Multifurca ochricompacta TaxID=376703 RepID=A0AAD4M7X0_9AGAM|nr:EXS family-domain-containing protein [Multifurca ochricompacta]
MDYETDDLSFVIAFPLPFRVLFLAGVGILGWAANIHGLHLLGIDAASALDLRAHEHGSTTPLPVDGRHRTLKVASDPSALYYPIYRLAFWYGLWCTSAWALYRSATHGSAILVDFFKYIPAVCALVTLIFILSPYDVMQKHERDAFLLSCQRCISPTINYRVHFSDVIFADIFTSFAKVLGDVWLSLCMLIPGGSLLTPPVQDGWYRWILPTLMSLPYLVRFRQCLVEYTSPSNDSRRPLWNALKYASSFPVIFLSAAQRLVVFDLVAAKGEGATQEAWHGEHALFRLWLLAALVNSLYSFWWDVTNDWGFDLLQFTPKSKRPRPLSLPRSLVLPAMREREESVTSPRNSTISSPPRLSSRLPAVNTHPYGLRSHLLYPLPVYPLVLFINLVLRLTWSIKLSSHLHARAQGEGSFFIFWVEVAELVRRWVWVFIRIEWEIVRRAEDGIKRAEMSSESGMDTDVDNFELVEHSLDEPKLRDRHS